MKDLTTIRPWLLMLILAVFFAGIYGYTLDKKLDLNGDNAIYLTLAHHMADGQGYSDYTAEGLKPTAKFPVGYPAILSVFMRLGIDDLVFFKCLNAFFMFVSIGLLYLIFNHLSKQNYLAFGIAALTLASTHLLHFAGMAMSEMSYLFCIVASMGAMYLYAREDNKEQSERKPFYRNPWFYVAFAGATFAYYIRSVGTTILFALVVFYLFRKEWWQALCSVAGMAVLLAPWMVRNAHYGLKSRYLGTLLQVNPWRPEEGQISSFKELFDKMITNLDETVIKGFREVLFPFWQVPAEPSTWWGVVVGLLIVAVIIWGAWNMKKWRWMMIAFLIANIGILSVWQGGNGSRYVTPFIPMLYLCFYYGIFVTIKLLLKDRLKEHTLWGLVLLMMLLPVRTPIQNLHAASQRPYPPAYKNYFQLAKQMNKTLPKGTVVICRKPELFCYFAPNIFATYYKFDLDPKVVIADMVERKAEYVILEQLGYGSTPRYLYPAIRRYPQVFPIVQHIKNPDTYLLKFDKEKAEQL